MEPDQLRENSPSKLEPSTPDLQVNGPGVISTSSADLGVAHIMATETPPEVIQAGILAEGKIGLSGYGPPLGLHEVRAAVASEFSRTEKVLVSPANVAIVEGGRAGTHAAIASAFLEKLDGNALGPHFRWPVYESQIALETKGQGEYLPVRGELESLYAPLAADYEKAIRPDTTLLIVTNPGNPIGHVYSREQLRDIISLAKIHNLPLLLDEAYEIFDFRRNSPRSSAFQSVEGNPELVAYLRSKATLARSMGKTFQCPGKRIGYLMAPDNVLDHLKTMQSAFTQSPNLPAQASLKAALEMSTQSRERYEDELLTIIQKNIADVYDWTHTTNGLVRPYTAELPSGSPLVFLNCEEICRKAGTDNVNHIVSILEHLGVKVNAGTSSGDPKAIRLAVGQPNRVVQEGLQVFSTYLKTEF